MKNFITNICRKIFSYCVQYKTVTFFIILLISIILIFFIVPYFITQTSSFWGYDGNSGVIGDTLGGTVGPIVGFIGIILTFFAFYIQFKANKVQIDALEEQKKASKEQEKQIYLQQFENNFFELLKIHRENVNEMEYRYNKGRNVMIKIVNEFNELLTKLKKSEIISGNDYGEQDVANVAFTILFFGVDESVLEVLQNRFYKKYHTILGELNEFIGELQSRSSPLNDDKYYFNGQQSRLGHYFRHLRRTITYVHRNSTLTFEQKREYVRLLRAQLSNHEQILLFFYSISDLGLKWELKNDNNETLITTYHLIRNIPLGSIYGFRPKFYYPKIKMENDFEVG